jgi:hypothetical protein
MWLERNRNSSLAPDVMVTLLGRLSPDPSFVDFVTPPVVCASMCSDQAAQMRLLREQPTLDDIGIIAQQRGDESRGIQIPVAGIADGQGSASTDPSCGKGKGKAAPRIILSDTEVSSEEDDVPQ